jgi:hypothetical protein
MKYLFICLIVVSLIPAQVVCQTNLAKLEEFSCKRRQIYLEFARSDSAGPLSYKGEGVWLRLHNESKWPIILFVVPKLKESGDSNNDVEEVVSYYDVERDYENNKVEAVPEGISRRTVSGFVQFRELIPEHSLLIHISRSHLSRGLKVFVPFLFGSGWNKNSDAKKPYLHGKQSGVCFRGSELSG